jgi:phage FluMu protein Com
VATDTFINTESKYGKIIDRAHHVNHIDDYNEINCAECDTAHEVEGMRDTYDWVEDRFNGSHYQKEGSTEVFCSTWECPTCKHINITEQEI